MTRGTLISRPDQSPRACWPGKGGVGVALHPGDEAGAQVAQHLLRGGLGDEVVGLRRVGHEIVELVAAAGLYHFDPGTFEGGLNLGLGFNLPAGPLFAIEATYNYHWVLTASPILKYDQVQIGLLVSF